MTLAAMADSAAMPKRPQVVDGKQVNDLPPHIVRLARMIARDCAAPGDYVVNLTVPDRASEPMKIEISGVSVIREAEAERK